MSESCATRTTAALRFIELEIVTNVSAEAGLANRLRSQALRALY